MSDEPIQNVEDYEFVGDDEPVDTRPQALKDLLMNMAENMPPEMAENFGMHVVEIDENGAKVVATSEPGHEMPDELKAIIEMITGKRNAVTMNTLEQTVDHYIDRFGRSGEGFREAAQHTEELTVERCEKHALHVRTSWGTTLNAEEATGFLAGYAHAGLKIHEDIVALNDHVSKEALLGMLTSPVLQVIDTKVVHGFFGACWALEDVKNGLWPITVVADEPISEDD